MSNRIFGQSASVKEGNGWFGSLPSCSSSVRPVLHVHLIIYVRVCEIFGRCIFCIFCISPVVHHFLFAESYTRPFSKMECSAQMDISMPGSKCVGEYPFGMFPFVFGRHPAPADGKTRVPLLRNPLQANASCTYSAYVGAISAPAVSTASQRRHNDSISSIILICNL